MASQVDKSTLEFLHLPAMNRIICFDAKSYYNQRDRMMVSTRNKMSKNLLRLAVDKMFYWKILQLSLPLPRWFIIEKFSFLFYGIFYSWNAKWILCKIDSVIWCIDASLKSIDMHWINCLYMVLWYTYITLDFFIVIHMIVCEAFGLDSITW